MRNACPVREKLREQRAVSYETLGERRDAGHHAHGCGAAQPAALDGRCVRPAASKRSNTAVTPARQVSSVRQKCKGGPAAFCVL